MQSVDEVGHELVRVVLRVAAEILAPIGNYIKELLWREMGVFSGPQLAEDCAEALCKLSFEAERILQVDVSQVAPAHEIVSKLRSVTEALQNAVHETGIAQVYQTGFTGLTQLLFAVRRI